MNKLELKKLIKEELKKALDEVSPETYISAANKMLGKDWVKRSKDLGKTYFREFIGKPLFNTIGNRGKITDVEMESPGRLAIKVTLTKQNEWRTQSGTMPPSIYGSTSSSPSTTEWLYYNLGKDEYQNIADILALIEDSKGAISKKDAVILWKIAKTINPNTKLTTNSVYYKIEGY